MSNSRVITENEFKQSMRNFAAAVNVVGVTLEEKPLGMLATAMCSACAQPPIVLVCINKSSSIHDILKFNENFCISVLEVRQLNIARKFMERETSERFSHCDWDTMYTGAPAIRGSLLNLDCVMHSRVEAGTHTTFFGRVVSSRQSPSGLPLLYHDGKFAALEPKLENVTI